MLIIFQCRSCDSRLEIEADTAGTTVVCPHCREELVVPRKGLEPGTTVGGFRILSLLGRGGMAEVYLARQISMDRLVALKILPAALTLQRPAVDRFLHEIKLAARLTHPHLVTAYEAGEDGGVLFFAMAYIDGPSLHARVKERGPLPEREALAIVRKIAEALAYAWNTEKLLHRDLKPSNVLLDSRGEPFLADLGLAKSLKSGEPVTVSGALVGTPNYMSPEQAHGRGKLDCRADMYGLGATLYTLLTARIPYASDDVLDTLRRKATEPLPDPRTYNPAITAPTLALMERLLAWDPRHRPATWEILLADVDAALAGRMPAGRPPAPAAADAEPPSPRVIALVLAGLLAAAVLGAGLTWIILHSRPPLPPPALTPRPDVPAPSTAVPPRMESVPLPAEPEAGATVSPPALDPQSLAAQWFRQARDYFQAHPQDFAGAMELFRKVSEQAPHTSFARRAEDFILNLQGLHDRLLRETEERLRSETAELMKQGRYGEALRRLRNSAGIMAGETAALRAELTRDVRQAQKTARDRERAALRAAALDELARAVLDGRATAARARLAQAQSELPEFADDWRSVAADLDAGLSGPAWLAQALQARVGGTVTLELRDGRVETGSVVAAAADVVTLRVTLPAGYAEKRISLAELDARTRFRLLADPPAPGAGLARGLCAVEAGQPAAARAQFEAVPTPLSQALLRLLPEPPPAGAP